MGQPVPIRISVDVDDPAAAERVAGALRAAGVTVGEVLDAIGTITGTCPEERIPELSRIPGVRSVERSRGVAIPPPSSPIQ